ncbi:hypothetical protein IJG79_00455 [Candidatus Saccharibacteria bacterium]|nr:hypothetical protein [Candidatus Saccharibacteria bacterium]
MKTNTKYVVADVINCNNESQRIHLKIRTEDGQLMSRRLRKILKDGSFVSAPITLYHDMANDLEEKMGSISPEIKQLMEEKVKDDVIDAIKNMRTSEFFYNNSQRISFCRKYFTCRMMIAHDVERVKNTLLYQAYEKALAENELLSKELEIIKDDALRRSD